MKRFTVCVFAWLRKCMRTNTSIFSVQNFLRGNTANDQHEQDFTRSAVLNVAPRSPVLNVESKRAHQVSLQVINTVPYPYFNKDENQIPEHCSNPE